MSATFSVFGAAPDTGNLGVSALLYGTLTGLSRSMPGFTPVVFDYGTGVRETTVDLTSHHLEVVMCGAYHTKRLYRPEALNRIRASIRFGGLGNQAADLMTHSAAILDLSGGDSFTDLYGEWRFRSITLPKLISLDAGMPLFLLPQTYGPFSDPARRRIAQKILRGTSVAWARDPWSYTKLQELLGDDFDPDRHREGVDVAFMMEASPPSSSPDHPLDEWLDDPSIAVAGINVSGLLYNGGEQARSQYGLASDYKGLLDELVRRLVRETDWKLVLVPHVTVEEGRQESDTGAARRLVDEIGESDRVMVAPSFRDPRHVKWLISRLDWFCGTRMHSTIAAMSSGVPVVALAYSDKTLGVFQSCGVGEYVFDLRKGDTETILEQVFRGWQARDMARSQLSDNLPRVMDRAREQTEELATAIEDAAARPRV